MNQLYLEVGTVIKSNKNIFFVKTDNRENGWHTFRRIDKPLAGFHISDFGLRHYEITDLDEETAKLIMAL